MSATFLSRQALLGAALSSVLLVGGCNNRGKSDAPEITVAADSLELSGADERALGEHFAVKPRGGSKADTLALLTELQLDRMTDGRTVDGSTARWTDWRAEDGDAVVTADSVVLQGLHDTDAGPAADQLLAKGLRFESADEDGAETLDMTVDELVIVEPSPSLLADLADILAGREESRELTERPEALADAQNFRALRLVGLDGTGREDDQSGTFSIAQVVVGNDREAGRADLVVESVDFNWSEDGAEDGFSLDMDGLTALGVDTSAGSPGLGVGGLLSGATQFMTPGAAAPYRQVDLGTLSVTSRGFDLAMSGFEADSDTSGDVTTVRSVLSPMTLTLKEAFGGPVAPYFAALQANGLSDISLKGSQTAAFDRKADRVSVSDSQLEIDEGLRLDCDYAVRGLKAAEDAVAASGATLPEPGALDTEAKVDAYLTQLGAYQEARAEASKLVKIEALACDVQDVADNSLVTRGYAVAEAVTGKPVAVLKGGAKTMIALSSLTAQNEFQRDLMDVVGTGLIDFIDNPGQTMRVRVAPEKPVSLTTLSGPDASLKPLGLSVTVE